MDNSELATRNRAQVAPLFLVPLAWLVAEVVFFNARMLPIILGFVTVVLLGALFYIGLKRVDDKTVDVLYQLRANVRVQALAAVVALVASVGLFPRGTGPLVALLILIIAVAIFQFTPRGVTNQDPQLSPELEDPPALLSQPSPIEHLSNIEQPIQDAASLPADPWQESA